MAQGRIKRLQSEARSQLQPFSLPDVTVCELCDRPIPPGLRDAHHLIPKSREGLLTVFVHRVCHKQVHAVFTEAELAKNFHSTQALREHPEMAKFIQWVQDKPPDFNPATRRSRSKGQRC